jgi:hypothetical protein
VVCPGPKCHTRGTLRTPRNVLPSVRRSATLACSSGALSPAFVSPLPAGAVDRDRKLAVGVRAR